MTGPQIAAKGGIAPADGPIAARFNYRHQYDDARDAIERAASDSYNTEPSMTMQHFTEDADINITLKRFGVTDGSILPALDLANVDPRWYGDFTDAVDLKTALDRMRTAEQHFMQLPAELRAMFNNNWSDLATWMENPANIDKAIELKLLTRAPAPAPAPAPATNPPTPPTPPAAPAP